MNSISTFDITKYPLLDILKDIKTGRIQLPDFQRDWVWDDLSVRRLLSSVSLAYPVGAVMLLQQENSHVRFKPRPVDGATLQQPSAPNLLILDGQQRLTTLFLVLLSEQPVLVKTSNSNKISRHRYYLDIEKALDSNKERLEALVALPESRKLRTFSGELIDASTPQQEFLAGLFPSRLPKGRDPTGQRYLQILGHISALPDLRDDSQKLEAELDRLTIQQQLPLFNELPYPIVFYSSGDLYWSVQPQDTSHPSDPENGSHPELPKSKKHQKPDGKRPTERISVKFKGVQSKEAKPNTGQSKEAKDHTFKIQCDRRQLPVFQQFLIDYQTYDNLPEEQRFSEGLFTLRSACLIWRKDESRHRSKKKIGTDQPEDQLQPWNTHRLYLHCTVDRRLLTAEGTQQVRAEKKQATLKELKGKDKLEQTELDELGLTKNQISSIKRQCSTLNRLEHNSPPPRPSTVPYEGQPDISVGVSFSRHQPVAIAVVDVNKQEVLECQSAKELLNRGKAQYIWRNGLKEPVLKDGIEQRHPNGGKLYVRKRKQVQWKPYRLVEQLHRRHQQNARRRAKQQQQNRYREDSSDSNLGLYVDRLIAAEIVELALQRKAGTIVIPQLKGVRESVESDIRAQAERKFPNEKERQKEYAQHYRASFHSWSYARLSECIRECAKKEGITVVERKQSSQGDLEQKAIAIALSS